MFAQVDVLIDETYAVDPTSYNLTTFLATYNLTEASVANYSWGGSTPKVPISSEFIAPAHVFTRENADVWALAPPPAPVSSVHE